MKATAQALRSDGEGDDQEVYSNCTDLGVLDQKVVLPPGRRCRDANREERRLSPVPTAHWRRSRPRRDVNSGGQQFRFWSAGPSQSWHQVMYHGRDDHPLTVASDYLGQAGQCVASRLSRYVS